MGGWVCVATTERACQMFSFTPATTACAEVLWPWLNLRLARCRDEVGLANPPPLKEGVHGCQPPYLGRGISLEVIANGNLPGRRPSAEPLVQYDRRSSSISEINIEVAAMRHIRLPQG